MTMGHETSAATSETMYAKHADKMEKSSLEPVTSIDHGDVSTLGEDGGDGTFHRSFSTHQVHIISLGSNIGSGLFIGTGGALANGGPGNIVIAYSLVCTCVWAVLQTLSEMTIAFPVSGNFIDYADRWVDPAVAFAAGFAEWLGWVAIVGSEAAFFNIFVQFWAGGDFPLAASMTIFIVACFAIFTLPNSVFAWFEYFTSMVKIFIFFIIIFLSLAIVCGAGPAGYVHDGLYWRTGAVFKNGFSGFAHAAILAVWAVGDQVFIGIMGGEAKNPRFSMGHAAKLVPYRVGVVYMSCIVLITLLISPENEDLLGGSGITASPFVIAIQEVKIPVIANIVNAGIMIGILAIAAESVYISSRMLRTMAHQRLIHGWVAHVDNKGRPMRSLYITCAAGAVFTYINLSAGGQTVLDWLVQITATSYFVNWIIIAFTSWRFHKAIKAQNDPLFSEVYAWKMSPGFPIPAAWLMLVCMILLVSCFYTGILPPGVTLSGVTANAFFQSTLGLWVIIGLSIGYKLIYRTPWRDPKTADLKTGRRVLTDADLQELNDYFALPPWRRFLTYVQVW